MLRHWAAATMPTPTTCMASPDATHGYRDRSGPRTRRLLITRRGCSRPWVLALALVAPRRRLAGPLVALRSPRFPQPLCIFIDNPGRLRVRFGDDLVSLFF